MHTLDKRMKQNKIDKRRLLFRQLHSYINRDVDDIKELSILVERTLKDEQNSIISRANREDTKNLSGFEEQFIAECYAEDLGKAQEVFPRILRYSLFVTSMSKFEGNVVSLCRGVKQLFKITENFNVRPPNIVYRGIEYLKSNVGINTNQYTHYINLADNYRILRNCIVHSEGDVKESRDKELLRELISDTSTLGLDRHDHVIIHEGFIDNSIHLTQLLMTKLLDSVEEKIIFQVS